ncbi:sigma-70 family RNA polymerase sigma factor [Chitinophaga pollutisoli]|uniref:Sigma-70 family RNA polymerase sigma factor n=1 Tax=Chitinophaga pollutisoli TaxID=3133966 RepID=A0ABZ2YPK6_9BACT
MTLIRNISQQRFRKIVEGTADRLYASMFPLCKDKAMCEDIMQETYIRLWKNLDQVKDDEAVLALLRTYARNIFLDEVRKTARRQQGMLQHAAEEKADSTEDYLYNRELNAQLQEAINMLPPQQQLIFRLHKEHALSYKQISAQMKITTGTIEVQMNRALKSLKKKLSHLKGNFPFL